jgi:hypothetical protein
MVNVRCCEAALEHKRGDEHLARDRQPVRGILFADQARYRLDLHKSRTRSPTTESFPSKQLVIMPRKRLARYRVLRR